jgi:hypothetical protein
LYSTDVPLEALKLDLLKAVDHDGLNEPDEPEA